MTMRIRRAEPSDADGIIDAHVRSIREVCCHDYSEEQIRIWSGKGFQASIWRQTMDRDYVLVIADQDRIHGFGHMRKAKNSTTVVEGLYFAPEAVGLGLGAKMLHQIYAEAVKHSVTKLVLQATLTGAGFYQRMGFTRVRDTVIDIGGIDLECVDMENSYPFGGGESAPAA